MQELQNWRISLGKRNRIVTGILVFLVATQITTLAFAGANDRSSRASSELAAVGQVVPADDPRQIRRAQQLLTELELYRGAISGRLDRSTVRVIRNFQRSAGVDIDGQASAALLKALQERLQSNALLNRMRRIEREGRAAARQALRTSPTPRRPENNQTKPFRADPSRDVSRCLARPTKTCLLREAVVSARAVHKDNMRDWALGEILVAQTRADFSDQAMATARQISDPRLFIRAMANVARAHARVGRAAEALAAAEAIPDAKIRLEGLAEVAAIHAKRNERVAAHRAVSRLLDGLPVSLSQLNDIVLRAQAARILHRIGAVAGAVANLEQSLAQLRTLPPGIKSNAVLGDIASGFAEIGAPARALKLIDEIRTDNVRIPVLISIAVVHARIGDATIAVHSVERITAARFRTQAFARIAEILARRGRKEEAFSALNSALAAARKVHLRFVRSDAFARVAFAALEVSAITGPAHSRELFELAEQALAKVGDTERRAAVLWALAGSRWPIDGDATQAKARAQLALDDIKSPLRRIWLLGDLAESYATQRQSDNAWLAFRDALEIASEIGNTWSRARAFARLSNTLVSLRNL